MPGRQDDWGEVCDAIAEPVLVAMAATPPPVLSAVGRALMLADQEGPLGYLGSTIWGAGTCGVDVITQLRLQFWLRRTGCRPVAADILERLEPAEGPLWAAVRRALKDAVAYFNTKQNGARLAD